MEDLKPQLPLPLPVHRALQRVGEDLNRARRRRGLSQKEVASRIGASVSTVKRMESGDPKIQFQFVARTLHLFGELQRLTELLDSTHDDIGLTLMDSQLPQRIHPVKKSKMVKSF
jgi:transcriptional regulator with XRE-family HTH domain